MAPGPTRVGRVYKKAVYREYTDSTFATPKPRPSEWEHLGILGPLIRAEVGDTVRIIYRNNVPFPTSLHPHGVFYEKDSEGAPYEDLTDERDKYDDGVPQGGTHTYVWPIPERTGPAEADNSTVFWMYHSHTEEVRDVNAGLIGPMIVHARGTLGSDGRPTDVDREVILSFLEFNENESWFMEDNVRTYMSNPDAIVFGRGPFGDRIATSDGLDWGGNFMETLNGLSYGHLEGLTMREGEKVRWYLMASTNFEIHAPHWHGNTVTIGRMRTDVSTLLPMGMAVAEMVPDNPGTWLVHTVLPAATDASP
jgi:FtsP/CotA-like multicopper oxidase with cupredoxin domain